MTSLVERARQLAELAKRRSDVLRDGDPAARNRARQLLEHVRAYVLPRAAALEVPLLIVIVGPPDLDSIERANRAVADVLVEAADLGVFVTSATRYADKVPFDVLQRIAARGLPVLVVVNHLPPDGGDQDVVLRDLRRVLEGTRLRGLDDARLEIVGIAEGQLAALTEGLDPGAAAPVVARIDELAADRGRRLALARR